MPKQGGGGKTSSTTKKARYQKYRDTLTREKNKVSRAKRIILSLENKVIKFSEKQEQLEKLISEYISIPAPRKLKKKIARLDTSGILREIDRQKGIQRKYQ